MNRNPLLKKCIDKNNTIKELEGLMMFPPQMIIDNDLYYSEFEVMGNKPITEKTD